jgi:hypothetical protein
MTTWDGFCWLSAGWFENPPDFYIRSLALFGQPVCVWNGNDTWLTTSASAAFLIQDAGMRGRPMIFLFVFILPYSFERFPSRARLPLLFQLFRQLVELEKSDVGPLPQRLARGAYDRCFPSNIWSDIWSSFSNFISSVYEERYLFIIPGAWLRTGLALALQRRHPPFACSHIWRGIDAAPRHRTHRSTWLGVWESVSTTIRRRSDGMVLGPKMLGWEAKTERRMDESLYTDVRQGLRQPRDFLPPPFFFPQSRRHYNERQNSKSKRKHDLAHKRKAKMGSSLLERTHMYGFKRRSKDWLGYFGREHRCTFGIPRRDRQYNMLALWVSYSGRRFFEMDFMLSVRLRRPKLLGTSI